MKHSEHAYIEAGYRYEKAQGKAAQAAAAAIRAMLDAETIDDQADARHLIERGREEARQ